MRCLGRALTLIAVLSLWPASAVGQSAEVMDAYNRYRELYTQGRYEQAIPFAEKALKLGERELGPKDRDTAPLLNDLALLYKIQGRYGEAEPLYRRALAIDEKTLGPEHPKVATTLSNLANLYPTFPRWVPNP